MGELNPVRYVHFDRASGTFFLSKEFISTLSDPTQLEYPLSGFKILNYYRCGVIRAVTEYQRGQSLHLINVSNVSSPFIVITSGSFIK